MREYIGMKHVLAKPMTRKEYNDHRGWGVPHDEDPNDQGYLFECRNAGKSNHPEHEGYISWTTRSLFHKQFCPIDGMDFGMALQLLKTGYKVARKGWNGKDMWIAYSPGAKQLPADKFWSPHASEHAKATGASDVLPCLVMKTANGEILIGWLASQTDLLADDWTIVE